MEVTAEEVCDDYVVQFGGDRVRYAGHLLDRPAARCAGRAAGSGWSRSVRCWRGGSRSRPSRSLSTRAGSMAVLAMLAFGLAGTLWRPCWSSARRGPGPGTREGRRGEARSGEETIRGQVVGPDGEPVAGATVIAWRSRSTPDGIGDPGDAPRKYEFSRKATDGDGRFALAVAVSKTDEPIDPSGPKSGQSVSAIATRRASAWVIS
ncbi:MAG: hypothetical protein WKF75_07995 [Singulisphaera sp.]